MRVLAEQVQFVEQHAGGPRSGQNVEVERLDAQLRAVEPVLDFLDVLTDLEALAQLNVRLDHSRGLAIGQIRNRLRRRDEQEFRPRPCVHQHRRQHQRGAVGRLGILLGDECEYLLDVARVGCGIARAE